MESTNYNGLKRAGANYVYYDIVLILRGGKRVVGITKSDEILILLMFIIH